MACILWLTVASINCETREVACNTENCEWLCKCTKGAVSKALRLSFEAGPFVGGAVLDAAVKAAEAAFKFWCFSPIRGTPSGYAFCSGKPTSSPCKGAGEILWVRINSRKARLVASTSAVALCASSKLL